MGKSNSQAKLQKPGQNSSRDLARVSDPTDQDQMHKRKLELEEESIKPDPLNQKLGQGTQRRCPQEPQRNLLLFAAAQKAQPPPLWLLWERKQTCPALLSHQPEGSRLTRLDPAGEQKGWGAALGALLPVTLAKDS